MKKAYFSNRVYKNTLIEGWVISISHALLVFNQSKHFSYQTQIKEKRNGKKKREESIHLTVKERYRLNDYYANSAVQEASAVMKSQDELKKMHIENKNAQIKSTKKKIKNTKSRLTTLKNIKESFVRGKPKFNKRSREQQKGAFFVVNYKQKADIYYHAYQFEHEYLDKEIVRLKARLGNLQFRLDRLEKQLKSLKINIKSVVFGTRKLFKAQHTIDKYKDDHNQWLKEWEQARYNQMTISGRKDSKAGNFVFTYVPETTTLHFTTPDGVAIEIPNLTFPYGQEKVAKAITEQSNLKGEMKKKFGQPIAWSIEDHGNYYIFKCITNEDENPNVNYSKSDGILGLDMNVDHIAWANVNRIGQLVKSGTFNFDIEGKTSGQIDKIIEAIAIYAVDLAVKLNRPIAVEKLNTTKSKVSSPYGNKKANKMKSMFAYKKLIQSIKNRADKMGIAVFDVNPAYTSQIGKIKYMKRFGISIHQAASYVIARRAMGYREKLPPVLYSLLPEKKVGLHHWAQWKWVSDTLSDIPKHLFYQIELSILSKHYTMCDIFPPGALTELVEKGLSKIESRNSVS